MRISRSSRVLATAASLALLGLTVPAAQAAAAEASSPPSTSDTTDATVTTDSSGAGSSATTAETAPVVMSGLSDPVSATVAPGQAARATLTTHRSRYKIADPDATLRTASVRSQGGRETVRLNQRYKGLPVFGAQYVVRMTKANGKRTVTGTSGTYFTDLSVDTDAKVLPVKTAVGRAVDAVENSLHPGQILVAHQADLTGTDDGLVIVPAGKGVLARKVTVKGTDPHTKLPVFQDAYVDAATGGLLTVNDRIQTLASPGEVNNSADTGTTATPAPDADTEPPPSGNGTTPVVGEGTTLDGATVPVGLTRVDDAGVYLMIDNSHKTAAGQTIPITTWDALGHDATELEYYGTFGSDVQPFISDSAELGQDLTDAGAVDAAWDADQVVDYWQTKHQRDSLDGQGMAINSYTAVTDGGQPYVNAFWDGAEMVYGTGDSEYKPLAADLDVVGHEMTHGVVSHTAGLVWGGQPGAVNEGIADYFGQAIKDDVEGVSMSDPDSGLVGGDLCRTLAPEQCAFRNLNDGSTVANFLSLPELGDINDDGGVHANSTIISGALWDIRQALGGDVADNIMYRALTDYLAPMSDFVDTRDAVIASARSFGLSKADMTVVKQAFASRGITPAWEDNLGGKGTTMLIDRIGLGAAEYTNLSPRTGGGWYAVSQTDPEFDDSPEVVIGKTNGKGTPRVVSLNDGRWNTDATTDGKNVVWVSWSDDFRIMEEPVTGGEPQVIYQTTQPIDGVAMDGNLVAWSEFTESANRYMVHYMKGRTGVIKTIPLTDGSVSATYPAVKDGRIAYAVDYENPDYSWAYGAEVYDTATDTLVQAGRDENAEAMGEVSLSSAGLAWEVDENWGQVYGDDLWWNTSVHDYTFADGKGRYVVEEGTPTQVAAEPKVAISDTTVTIAVAPSYGEWTTWTAPTNDTNDKLAQYNLKGRYLGEASCSPGAQLSPDAATGREVVYLDSAGSAYGVADAAGAEKC